MPYGIKVLPVKNKSAVATKITSTTVIGLVVAVVLTQLDAELKKKLEEQRGLLLFSSAEEALKSFRGVTGTAREDLWDIQAQNVKSPVVLSVVGITEAESKKSPKDFYGNAKIKSKIVEAVKNLQLARTIFGSANKVRIATAGWFSFDDTVAGALDSLSVGTKTISIVDLGLDSVQSALTKLEKLGSQRQLVFPFYRKSWSVFEDKQLEKPNSAVVAGHIAYWDAQLGEFGFAFDHANRLIYDVAGSTVPLTYEEGEDTCEVNRIVNAGGTLLINDDGWRLYNYETPTDDQTFNKLEVVRLFDGLNENLQKALKKHKHRPAIDVFALAKADANTFLGKAVKAGASVGAKAWWSDKNTPSEVASGTIYMDYDNGANVGIRTIVIQPLATTEYYAKLIANNK